MACSTTLGDDPSVRFCKVMACVVRMVVAIANTVLLVLMMFYWEMKSQTARTEMVATVSNGRACRGRWQRGNNEEDWFCCLRIERRWTVIQ